MVLEKMPTSTSIANGLTFVVSNRILVFYLSSNVFLKLSIHIRIYEWTILKNQYYNSKNGAVLVFYLEILYSWNYTNLNLSMHELSDNYFLLYSTDGISISLGTQLSSDVANFAFDLLSLLVDSKYWTSRIPYRLASNSLKNVNLFSYS